MFSFVTDLKKHSIAEIIEIAQQLEVGILANKCLPAQWSNPGVAGLVAFRMISDTMRQNLTELSVEQVEFIKKIDLASESAIKEIKSKGASAWLKPSINKLMEAAGGFQRIEYTTDELNQLKKLVSDEKLSTTGQLAYHKKNKRFFLIVDPNFYFKTQKLFDNKGMPDTYIGHAHCSLSDNMDIKLTEDLFPVYQKRYGEAKNPLFLIKDSEINKEMVYFEKKIDFSIVGANVSIPKTNSQLVKTKQFNLYSPELEKMGKPVKEGGDSLRCPFDDYRHQVTIFSEKRQAYPGLKKGMTISDLLGSGLSEDLKKELLTFKCEKVLSSPSMLFQAHSVVKSDDIVYYYPVSEYKKDHWALQFPKITDENFIAILKIDDVLMNVKLNSSDARGYRAIVTIVAEDMASTLNRAYSKNEKRALQSVLGLVSEAYENAGVPPNSVQQAIAGNNSQELTKEGKLQIGNAKEPYMLHGHIIIRGNPKKAYFGNVLLNGPVPNIMFNMRGDGTEEGNKSKLKWNMGDMNAIASVILEQLKLIIRECNHIVMVAERGQLDKLQPKASL